MSIEFERPWLLLLLIPLLAAACIPFFKAGKRRTGRRHLVAFILRLVSLLLAVSVISGFTARRTSDKNAVIVVADLSDSTRSVADEIKQAVKIAAGYADRKTEVGLITFGYNSYYEIPLGGELTFTGFETKPAGNYTDMEAALVKAVAMMPEGSAKRIILLTDGKENIGSIKDAASVLMQKSVRLDAIVYETGITGREVQITDISLPETAYKGENFNITVVVESSCECNAELSLYCDTQLASEQSVRLTEGTNRFVFRAAAETSGITSYSARITTEDDSLEKNNSVYSFIKVLGIPKLLIIDGTGNEAHELEKIIGDAAEVDCVSAAQAPADITELRKYDAVILMNASKSALPENWETLADVYVRQLGRGLFTTGGSKSYALGGWTDTLLETMLPVDMEAKDKVAFCDMALMLLVDNSGSMGGGAGSPLELAKQGAINAAGAIKDIDEVGVIAFSDNATWIAKLTPGSEKSKVQGAISSIPEGGGTMIYSALKSAYEALVNSDKSMKNIILLTDGEPADGDQVFNSGLPQLMAEKGITVTAIAVGITMDTNLLQRICEPTGGSVTVVTNVNSLPEVIFTETVKAMDNKYINNVTFTPAVEDYTSVLSGVTALPELDGYILTTAKDLAYTVLATDDGDPVLATWQYGLGKVASLTTDLNGKWSSKLLESENGRALIMNVISYILPSDEDSEGGAVTLTRSGNKGLITAISADKEQSYTTTALIISPTGNEKTVELVQTGLGEYSGEFMLEEEGGYVAVVTQKDVDGNVIMNRESALAVKYSDEYDMFVTDTGAVAAACLKTGGSADWEDIESILKEKLTAARESLQFTNLFLALIIILTMCDIALRRLNINIKLPKLRKKGSEPAEGTEAAASAGAAHAAAAATAVAAKPSAAPRTQLYRPSGASETGNAAEKAQSPAKNPANSGKAVSDEPERQKKDSASTVSELLKQKNGRNRRQM